MANSRSARKRIRANERKHLRNRSVRSSVRTKITKARRALLGTDVGVTTEEQVLVAVQALDRAAEKGILHRNNAARRKSRLMSMANRLQRAAASGEEATARAAAAGGQKGRSGRAASGSAKGGASRSTATRSTAKAGTTSAAKGGTRGASKTPSKTTTPRAKKA